MPYTRAYQLQLPFAETPAAQLNVEEPPVTDTSLNIEETSAKLGPMLNVTSSSNWIQETFYASDIIVEEVETEEGIKRVGLFLINKGKQSSLYQKFSDMQVRAKLFRIKISASKPVPNAETRKKFIEKANGDTVELDKINKDWEMEIIKQSNDADFNGFIDNITEDTVYLQADPFLRAGIESIRLTIFSPDMPTRGDLPVTAIYYSQVDGDRLTAADDGVGGEIGVIDGSYQVGTIAGGPRPFTWVDKSGFRSTIVILPNVVYEIQPVSIELDYKITLLA